MRKLKFQASVRLTRTKIPHVVYTHKEGSGLCVSNFFCTSSKGKYKGCKVILFHSL